jgi:Mg-chelatase subunit ChlD
MTPGDALTHLAMCQTPFLIGVRHHSPACAAAIPALLDAFAPERLFVELPADFASWLEWLGHPDAVAPLALAAAGDGVCFYPFADFSPELVAIRWARENGVPVEAFDLPVGARIAGSATRIERPERSAGARIPDWDSLVEAPAVTASPEATRRAALVYGWALRRANGASPRDLAREAYMRARLRAAPGVRAAVVTGAFHDAALLPDAELDPILRDDTLPSILGGGAGTPATSLIPYRVDLFDARSGYPAGILDPGWHRRVFTCLTTGAPLDAMVAGVMVEVCRDLRARRHVAGPPDAVEALRIALELARMRGLGAPGRTEVLEGVQTALGQGELLGRGRIVAKALEHVLVGTGRGRLAPGTPRSGLLPSVEALLVALRLPGPDEAQERLLRLDPLRSELDRRRHVALTRLGALDVPYAQLADTADDTLTHAWRVRWEPATEAALALAGAFGADLGQATAGALTRARPADDGEDGVPPEAELGWLTAVAECGLVDLARAGLDTLAGSFATRAGLAAMVRAVALVDRIAHGHVPGLQPEGSPSGAAGGIPAFRLEDPPGEAEHGSTPDTSADTRPDTAADPSDDTSTDTSTDTSADAATDTPDPSPTHRRLAATREALYVVAVRSLDGLTGSTDPADARALGALVRLATTEGRADDGRLGRAVDALARDGAPRIAGSALIARLRLGRADAAAVGAELGASVDAAEGEAARRDLGDRLAGAIEAAGTLLESHPPLLDGLARVVEGLSDDAFLHRLPTLRHGFDVSSTAARTRLLATLADRLGADAPDASPLDAEMAALDAAGRRAVVALGLWPAAIPDLGTPELVRRPAAARALAPLTRWRLILGREEDRLDPVAARYATALDELYGHGHGEGSRGDPGDAGGHGTPFPTVREWAEEIGTLFGDGVRLEVVGRAAERGEGNALLLLDPDEVTPSVALLEQALALKGGLSEEQLALLRRLCRRVTAALAEALAVRVRPALTGLSSPRATRRHTDRLHLRRTVEANLHTVRRDGDGVRIVPERLHFRTRARRHMDWHVVLVVDTSGSMEASVIHAAMMAAILSALPAVTVSFYGFADEVVDFTDRVEDPLALLLEVHIGGGTRIHRALRYARDRLKVPARTLLLLVTDFEEGGSPQALLGEVRALAEAGVTMLGLAALDEGAKPRFSEPMAARVVAAGMPVAALSPLELARWVAERIRGAS